MCIYIYIYNIINNSRRKDKGNQWHDVYLIQNSADLRKL